MSADEIEYTLDTEQLAAIGLVKPQSVRAAYARTGSYFGLIPQKLPNGRLLWPADSKQRLLARRASPQHT